MHRPYVQKETARIVKILAIRPDNFHVSEMTFEVYFNMSKSFFTVTMTPSPIVPIYSDFWPKAVFFLYCMISIYFSPM